MARRQPGVCAQQRLSPGRTMAPPRPAVEPGSPLRGAQTLVQRMGLTQARGLARAGVVTRAVQDLIIRRGAAPPSPRVVGAPQGRRSGWLYLRTAAPLWATAWPRPPPPRPPPAALLARSPPRAPPEQPGGAAPCRAGGHGARAPARARLSVLWARRAHRAA